MELQRSEFERNRLDKMQADREAKRKYNDQLRFQILQNKERNVVNPQTKHEHFDVSKTVFIWISNP